MGTARRVPGGVMHTWGQGDRGQIGDGTVNEWQYTPFQVPLKQTIAECHAPRPKVPPICTLPVGLATRSVFFFWPIQYLNGKVGKPFGGFSANFSPILGELSFSKIGPFGHLGNVFGLCITQKIWTLSFKKTILPFTRYLAIWAFLVT